MTFGTRRQFRGSELQLAVLLGGLFWFVFMAAVAGILPIVARVLMTDGARLILFAPAVVDGEMVAGNGRAPPSLRVMTRLAISAEFAAMYWRISVATDAARCRARELRGLVATHASHLSVRTGEREFRLSVIKAHECFLIQLGSFPSFR